jgi:hypothetical protein
MLSIVDVMPSGAVLIFTVITIQYPNKRHRKRTFKMIVVLQAQQRLKNWQICKPPDQDSPVRATKSSN